MSKKPVLKATRPGFDVRTATDKDLAFSSEWETPKIFLQTSSNWTNTLGYIPSFMAFRKLNTTDFTHDIQDKGSDTDPQQGAYLDSSGNLYLNTRSGDSDMYGVLFFSPLSGTVPSSYTAELTHRITIAKEGYTVDAHPANLSIDSRFDTFKIYKTGTLTLELPAETIAAGGSNKVYTATVDHSLGYAPIYLPRASVNWYLYQSGLSRNDSFVVNDILGYLNGSEFSWYDLDVYVDSSKLYMKYTRKGDIATAWDYSAITVTMYYTIFYNRIDEEFNLLEN